LQIDSIAGGHPVPFISLIPGETTRGLRYPRSKSVRGAAGLKSALRNFVKEETESAGCRRCYPLAAAPKGLLSRRGGGSGGIRTGLKSRRYLSSSRR